MAAITARTTSRLTDVRLVRLLRAVWLAVVPLVLGMFLLSLPAEYITFRDGEGWGLSFQAALSQLGLSREFFAAYITALDIFEVLFSLMLAVIIFRQRADDWVAWLSSVLIATYSTSITLAFYLTSPTLAAIIRTAIPVLTIFAIVVYPDGRFIPSWTRWLVIGVLVISLLELVLVALNITGQYQFGYLGYPLAILALALRYRDARLTAAERQQTKWVLWGVIISFFAVAVYWLVPMLFPQLASRDSSVPVYTTASLISFLITNTLRLSSSVIFVAGLGFSIVHYRLWDIDLTINRSLVYGSLTLGLGAIFVLIFLGAQAVLTAVLGGEHAALSVAVSAAATAVLFHPVRTRIQHFVDRRIYGFNFDLHQLHQALQKPEVKNPGLFTGRRFGSYEVLGVLGRGGMGEVYQGVDGSQKVALKVLPSDLAEQTEFLKRFEREAQAMKMLDHPYILKLIDSGVQDGVHYLALEYIDGLGLNEYLKQQGVLSLAETRGMVHEIASALDYAHERGLVHRDIKPSNVMLRANGAAPHAVLMDFGIAKLRDSQTRYTGSGAIGTIDYMAPEQILAAREVDHRADVYALGVMTFEMLTGRHPFEGGPAQVMFAHLQQPAPDARSLRPDLPDAPAQALLRALAKDPAERFASAGAFAQSL